MSDQNPPAAPQPGGLMAVPSPDQNEEGVISSSPPSSAGADHESGTGQGYWKLVWVQFRKRREAFIGLFLLSGLFLVALAAPFLANNLPLYYNDGSGAHFPLLRDFLFPLLEIDRFYNCLLITLLIALALEWTVRRRLDALSALRRGWVPLITGIFATLFMISVAVGGQNDTRNYKKEQASGKSVLFTLIPYGSLEDESERSDLPPAGLSTIFSMGSQSIDWTKLSAQDREKLASEFNAKSSSDADLEQALRSELKSGRRPKVKLSALEYEARIKSIDDDKTIRTEGHLLGCDNNGFDVLARIIHGSRISLAVGFLAMGLAVLIGVIVGALSGYYGGWVDLLAARVIEIFICFPSFFLILTIIAIAPRRSIFWVMFAISLTGWMGVARLIRGEVLKVRQLDYVQAARAMGLSDLRIVFKHILPNAMAPVLVAATFGVAGAILSETGLGFLGLGVEPPTPSWGELLNQARQDPTRLWWLTIYPGFMIFLSVTLMNLVGEGLRDAMDPKMRR